jgi:8-oxo-dGTP pyrophosphatase MutT (NUDIX family)
MARRMRKAPAPKAMGVQYGALPWRLNGQMLQLLLVTSRQTRRWIIPKGWPMEGCTPARCAALEAEEEAGVMGEIGKTAVGRFRYMKLLRDGVELSCRVEVFPLKVTQEKPEWKEMEMRARRWCTPADATAAVIEPQLKAVIRRFAVRMATEKRRKLADGAHGRRTS